MQRHVVKNNSHLVRVDYRRAKSHIGLFRDLWWTVGRDCSMWGTNIHHHHWLELQLRRRRDKLCTNWCNLDHSCSMFVEQRSSKNLGFH